MGQREEEEVQEEEEEEDDEEGDGEGEVVAVVVPEKGRARRTAQVQMEVCDVNRGAAVVAAAALLPVPQHSPLLDRHQLPPPTACGPLQQQLLPPARETPMSPPRFRHNEEQRLLPSARAQINREKKVAATVRQTLVLAPQAAAAVATVTTAWCRPHEVGP